MASASAWHIAKKRPAIPNFDAAWKPLGLEIYDELEVNVPTHHVYFFTTTHTQTHTHTHTTHTLCRPRGEYKHKAARSSNTRTFISVFPLRSEWRTIPQTVSSLCEREREEEGEKRRRYEFIYLSPAIAHTYPPRYLTITYLTPHSHSHTLTSPRALPHTHTHTNPPHSLTHTHNPHLEHSHTLTHILTSSTLSKAAGRLQRLCTHLTT